MTKGSTGAAATHVTLTSRECPCGTWVDGRGRDANDTRHECPLMGGLPFTVPADGTYVIAGLAYRLSEGTVVDENLLPTLDPRRAAQNGIEAARAISTSRCPDCQYEMGHEPGCGMGPNVE